jgi:GT2 family glycosyltransferase
MKPDFTVVVATYNRCRDLADILLALVSQDGTDEFSYEILVVDNNSTDRTRAVVEALQGRGYENLRYCFEGHQGKSYALNTALERAAGSLYAIADDDFVIEADWLNRIARAFSEHPTASIVGGKVLPVWSESPPGWLTESCWAPLALCDYGDEVRVTDRRHPLCLLAAALRRADVISVGGYRSDLGVSGRSRIGGTEDAELQLRMYRAGYRGVYVPGVVTYHKVPRERTTRAYHRRWHYSHGRFYAAMRDESLERSRGRILGVPGHLYRQAGQDATALTKAMLTGDAEEAMKREMRLQFFGGFCRGRWTAGG